MRITVYEALSLRGIARWEREEPGGLKRRVLDLASVPITSLMEVAGHDRLQSLENVVRLGMQRLLHTTAPALSKRDLLARARAHGVMLRSYDDLPRCSLQALDRCNRRHIKVHGRAACLVGAATGVGGPLFAAVDLTALLLANFRLVQHIAFCYGYDPNDGLERQILLRVLLAGIGSTEMKTRALAEVRELERLRGLRRCSPDNLSALGSRALAEYAEQTTIALLLRFLPRVLPVVSIVLAAHNNHELVHRVGRTGFMVYRRRFVERKRGL